MSGRLSPSCPRSSDENFIPFWSDYAELSLMEGVGGFGEAGNASVKSKQDGRAFKKAAMSIADSCSLG